MEKWNGECEVCEVEREGDVMGEEEKFVCYVCVGIEYRGVCEKCGSEDWVMKLDGKKLCERCL
jgi:hypothetical protein